MALYGKYRGVVIDNIDPLRRGRLLCQVASLTIDLNWALPCTPYGGPLEGFFALPPVGATVWVEFEGGSPDFPIWTGCFWEPLEIPPATDVAPEAALVKTLQSETGQVTLNDTPEEGGITLMTNPPAAALPVILTMNSVGFSVTVGDLSLVMDPEVGITLTAGESVLVLTPEGCELTTPSVAVVAEDVSVEAVTSIVGDTSIIGATEITGAVDINGETNIVGVLSAEPAVDIVGALGVEGESNFLGAVTAEGEVNVAGALTVEGDLALAGAAEMVDITVALINGLTYPPLPV